jgi:hypothetical protein
MIYLERAFSTEEGRTWKEFSKGTKSRIVPPCPCRSASVSPEHEHGRR